MEKSQNEALEMKVFEWLLFRNDQLVPTSRLKSQVLWRFSLKNKKYVQEFFPHTFILLFFNHHHF